MRRGGYHRPLAYTLSWFVSCDNEFLCEHFLFENQHAFFHEKIESEFRPNIIGSIESRAEFRLVSEII